MSAGAPGPLSMMLISMGSGSRGRHQLGGRFFPQCQPALEKLPDLVDRIDHYFPAPGGAPPELPEVQVDVKQLPSPGWRDLLFALGGAGVGAAALYFFG